ncbi:MAG: hypothetical protein LBB87_03500 [Nitrososphaerota archaeon]|nr:hypothetical protein [Nitrososphaerota archaeon]
MGSRRRRNSRNCKTRKNPPRHRHLNFKKTKNQVTNINETFFKTHKEAKISIELDEMWSFVGDKSHQCWLWWAVDHLSGVPIAFWFGGRDAGNFKMLQKLLAPLNIVMYYVDGNWAYVNNIVAGVLMVSKRFTQKIERKHLSLRTWCSWLVRRVFVFQKVKRCIKLLLDTQLTLECLKETQLLRKFRT